MKEGTVNLAKLSEEKALREGERVVIIFEGREITNMEMLGRARKMAAAFKKIGVRRGDRIILQMPNCPEVLECFGAAWRIGAVIVPINYLVGEEETAYIYQDSGARVVVSSRAYLPKIQAGRRKAPEMQTVILIEDDAPAETLSYRQLLENSPEDEDIADMDGDDMAALIYTSGTTGKPKGVIHTHQSLYANAKMSYDTITLPDNMTSVSVLPLCHSYGIANLNNGLFRTGRMVLLNTFDLDDIYSSIEKYRADIMSGVPTMYVYMLLYPNPKKYDLRSMKYWISGSAPLALETWTKFKQVFGSEIIEGWGLTEAGANNTVNPLDGLKKVGSIGLPMKGTDIQIVDHAGNALGPHQQGEIVIGGPQLMKGYWNKPEETAEILRDGWLRTGDVGYVDDDGYYWITDRLKDLIIKGGENISPRTIEEVLYSHPKVSEAAVVGMKDDVYGENIKAFLVLHPGETATAEEIIEYCRIKLAKFFLPKEVVFLPSFPKTLVGKILKKELRNM
jgi:long-chain acyl-CoA synthetase